MTTCGIQGCERQHRARGLCSSHYNKTYLPKRHARRIEVPCAWCGTPIIRSATNSKSRRPACSTDCRYAIQHGRRRPGRELIGPLRSTRPTVSRADRKPTPARQWTSGPCGWCGTQFTAQRMGTSGTSGRWCSPSCRRKAAKALRRAREAGATGAYTWAEVVHLWVAIDRTCTYCAAPIDAGQIDPDHVHPLSRGGSNSLANIVPSCRACNRDKRDLLLDEWFDSRAARGLAPRRLDPRMTHVTSIQRALKKVGS